MLVYMCTYIDHYDNMMAMGLCLTDWRARLLFRTCAMFAEALWEPTKTLRNHSILPGEEKGVGNNKTEELSVAVLQHACNTRGQCDCWPWLSNPLSAAQTRVSPNIVWIKLARHVLH